MSPYFAKNYSCRKTRPWKFWVCVINLFLIVLIPSLTFAYLMQINSTVLKGDQAQELQKKINNLKADYRMLTVQAAEAQSMTNLQARVSSLPMVASAKFDYLKASPAVVVNR